MTILINDRSGLMDRSQQELAERRLHFALSRFDSRISRLELVVEDENGPRGGVDKAIRLLVKLKRASDVVISDRDSDLITCISRVAERAARSVTRSIERSQQFDRVRPEFADPGLAN